MNILKTIGSVILGIALSSSALSAQAKTLVYTDHEPLGNMRTRFINEVFFPAIEKESNGRLKIEAHWNGELSISYDALRKVAKEGVADIGTVVPEYAPNELPLHQIFKGFPVGPSGDKQVQFFQHAYKNIPAFSQELEKANIEVLMFCTGYPVAFFSPKPLDNLKDIRDQRWRTASFWHRDFLKNAGAVPVSMPWNDGIFKALREGTLDGLMVNVDSGYDLKAHEAAPNILLSKDLWLGHLYLVVMNKTTWDNLAPEDQAAIQRAAATAYKTLGSVMDSSFNAQIETLKKAGAKIRILSPEEVADWKTATDYQTLQTAWAKEQETKGIKNAATTMEKVSAILNDQEIVQNPVITAKDLYDAFKNHKQTAGELYSKKTINVKGFVVYTGPDPYALPSIELSEIKGGKSRLLCVLPFSDFLKLRKISKGDEVTIRGEVRALYEKGDMVLLKQCEILETKKDTSKN